jgi:hypothetical protein
MERRANADSAFENGFLRQECRASVPLAPKACHVPRGLRGLPQFSGFAGRLAVVMGEAHVVDGTGKPSHPPLESMMAARGDDTLHWRVSSRPQKISAPATRGLWGWKLVTQVMDSAIHNSYEREQHWLGREDGRDTLHWRVSSVSPSVFDKAKKSDFPSIDGW